MALKIPVPDYIDRFVPYAQSKPHAEKTDEPAVPKGLVRLSANENPLGPSPKAAEAVRRAAGAANIYPDAHARALRAALSEKLGVPPEWLICGNGSDELLLMAAQVFIRPGDEGVYPWPSFVFYKLLTELAGGTAHAVPLKDHRIDVDAFAAKANERTRAVFLASPNNPTGTAMTADELTRLMDETPETALVVLDEAYIDFVREEERIDTVAFVKRYENLIALRTFSKFYGLAGLRVGYGIAQPELISYLHRARMPYNVNALAQAAATAALSDTEHERATLDTVHGGVAYLCKHLDALGLTYVPTQANFLLVDAGGDGQAFCDAVARHGYDIRPMSDYGMPAHVRISVGRPEDNEKLIAAMADAMGK